MKKNIFKDIRNFHRNLTYRTRRRLHTIGTVLAAVGLTLVLVLVGWFAWLDRFVVYSADGAHLDFDADYHITDGVEALPPERPTVQIHYNEGENIVNSNNNAPAELTPIGGYYVTTGMLLDSIEDVETAITNLPAGGAVMIDLKSIYGNFYYSTSVPGAPIATQLNIPAMDHLLEELTSSDTYVIAKVPALRDRSFGLNNTSYGLSGSQGKGYLWADDANCYWLDPTASGTVSYLISIASELRRMGFDEVVFDEFRFPPTDAILFSGNRDEAIATAADTLVSSCATESFTVSFLSTSVSFPLPTGRTRLYLTGVEASSARSVFDECSFPMKEAQLVFLTDTNDTRYDIAGALRPLPVEQEPAE